MKLSTELRNLPIVSIAEGEEVGVVKDFIIDPTLKAIVAIVIEDPNWYEGAKIISFSLVHSIGDFAITTENASSVVALTGMPELAQLLKKDIRIVGAKIITRGGRLVGFVKEYSIDDRTGEILGLELSSDSELASPDRNIIPCASIVTIGRDVIIVNEDIETALCSSHNEVAGDIAASPRPRPVPRPAPKPAAPAFVPPAAPIEDDFISAPAAPIAVEPEPPSAGIHADSDVDIEELLDLDAKVDAIAEELPPEPAPSRPAPTRAEAEGAKESLTEIFERRQIKYMLGKKVSQDIETDDGSIVIQQGQTITEEVIARAKSSGKFLELSMNIEIEE